MDLTFNFADFNDEETIVEFQESEENPDVEIDILENYVLTQVDNEDDEQDDIPTLVRVI